MENLQLIDKQKRQIDFLQSLLPEHARVEMTTKVPATTAMSKQSETEDEGSMYL